MPVAASKRPGPVATATATATTVSTTGSRVADFIKGVALESSAMLLGRQAAAPHTPGMPPAEGVAAALAAGMALDGRPLEPPRFHPTDWKPGQRFDYDDDPDRMVSESWSAPAFVREVDPAVQAAGTTVEEVPVAARRGSGRASFARVVRNALTPAQCREVLAAVNRKGFTPALVNNGGGMQRLLPDYRDGWRCMVDSPELTEWLMEVLRPHLPGTLPDSTGAMAARVSELNERCRVLCYTPGQKFDPHCDGRYCRPMGHDKFGDVSRVTVQLYLHDVPAESGGATTFFPGLAGEHPCQPVAGSVLLFSQDLLHEGSMLQQGLKYTIRTEVMYSREPHPAVGRG